MITSHGKGKKMEVKFLLIFSSSITLISPSFYCPIAQALPVPPQDDPPKFTSSLITPFPSLLNSQNCRHLSVGYPIPPFCFSQIFPLPKLISYQSLFPQPDSPFLPPFPSLEPPPSSFPKNDPCDTTFFFTSFYRPHASLLHSHPYPPSPQPLISFLTSNCCGV